MASEVMEFDVLIVGAGPAGLAAAIRLKQRLGEAISVGIIDKGRQVGSHILSGAVIDPRGLDELIPDWSRRTAPLTTRVAHDRFLWLAEKSALTLPRWSLPAAQKNDDLWVGSLGRLCEWLASEAETLGVEIYPGFAGVSLICEEGRVCGVLTGDMGRRKDGSTGPGFEPGIELRAKYTLFGEGCRGHLGLQLEKLFGLRDGVCPQTHGLGIKELWEVEASRFSPGSVLHTAGWPLTSRTYGGGFLYQYGENLAAVGLVVGLGYRNPYLSPFAEFQRFKTHPAIAATLAGGRRLAYGARAITAGGLQSLPRLVFPGGALIGDDAGFLNAARTKGIHGAIKSGMLAADAAADALTQGRARDELEAYPAAFRKSWLHEELHRTRNFKPLMAKGLWLGAPAWGLDQHLLRGRAPWTFANSADHEKLAPAERSRPIDYPKADDKLSFDLSSSLFLSGTDHESDQPCHLKLVDESAAIRINLKIYGSPEQHYCPAGVYEIEDGRLAIHAQNCLHCKSCDIKDPGQNIVWTPPQGGEGPNYPGM